MKLLIIFTVLLHSVFAHAQNEQTGLNKQANLIKDYWFCGGEGTRWSDISGNTSAEIIDSILDPTSGFGAQRKPLISGNKVNLPPSLNCEVKSVVKRDAPSADYLVTCKSSSIKEFPSSRYIIVKQMDGGRVEIQDYIVAKDKADDARMKGSRSSVIPGAFLQARRDCITSQELSKALGCSELVAGKLAGSLVKVERGCVVDKNINDPDFAEAAARSDSFDLFCDLRKSGSLAVRKKESEKLLNFCQDNTLNSDPIKRTAPQGGSSQQGSGAR